MPFVLLALLIAMLVACRESDGRKPGGAPVTQKPSLYQRVMTSGKIRCSYCSYPPYCIRDANSGKFSGIFVEALEAIGKRLDLRIEWAAEVSWDSILEGLDSEKFDVHGSGLWENATRGKKAAFTSPLFFNPIYVWVRGDESRFSNVADLDSPTVRVAVQDGAMEELIAKNDFPKAQRVSLPQMNPWTDNLLNITSNKADATFAEPGVVLPFVEKHKGSLRQLGTGRPIRVFSNAFPFKLGEAEFKSMMDSAISELLNDGTMDVILRRYETAPGQHLRVATPYEYPR